MFKTKNFYVLLVKMVLYACGKHYEIYLPQGQTIQNWKAHLINTISRLPSLKV